MNSYQVNVDVDLKDLIPRFMENRNIELKNLIEASEKAEFKRLRSIGHSMKGTCAGYGFHELGEIGESIEALADARQIEPIKDCVKRYQDFLENVEILYVEDSEE